MHGVDCSGLLQYRLCRLGWRGGAWCGLQWLAASIDYVDSAGGVVQGVDCCGLLQLWFC